MNPGPPATAPACPVCEERRWFPLLESMVPVHCNRLEDSAEAARAAPKGRFELQLCRACGMVFNTAFDPALMTYDPDYENAQHFSPRFRRYLEELTADLVERYDLRGKDVLEIGCGDAYFLQLLCRQGSNRGYGYDPAAPVKSPDPSVTLIHDLYGPQYADRPADLVACRHVLEHLERPADLIRSLHATLQPQPNASIYFEVPDGRFTFESLGIWDLLYEHCSYFTDRSLHRLFHRHGFTVSGWESRFDGQFLALHGARANGEASAKEPARMPVEEPEVPSWAAQFRQVYHEQLEQWGGRIRQWVDQGRVVVVWGAGTKGVMFLNSVRGADWVKAVVDVNPRKCGKFVAGTGQPIVAPPALAELRPDVVVVVNPAYREEIVTDLARRGLQPQVEVLSVAQQDPGLAVG